jgi:hypothetical protein
MCMEDYPVQYSLSSKLTQISNQTKTLKKPQNHFTLKKINKRLKQRLDIRYQATNKILRPNTVQI